MIFLKILIWIPILLAINCSPKKPMKVCSDEYKSINCTNIPFDSLIIASNKFEDKCIELEGYLVLRFHEVGLFKSKGRTISDGAVWLMWENTIERQILKNYPKGVPGKISVTGVFNTTTSRFGHFGELSKISCVEIK